MDKRARLRELVNLLPDGQLQSAVLWLESRVNNPPDAPASSSASLQMVMDEWDDEDDGLDEPFQIERIGDRQMAKDWGGGIEEIDATTFKVTSSDETSLKLHVGPVYGGREAYGADRARYHVVVKGSHVIMEFTGTDDFEETGRVFSILKRGDRSHVKDGDEIPDAYRRFPIEPVADLVDDGRRYRSLAIVLQSDDLASMALCGFLRWRDLYGEE